MIGGEKRKKKVKEKIFKKKRKKVRNRFMGGIITRIKDSSWQ